MKADILSMDSDDSDYDEDEKLEAEKEYEAQIRRAEDELWDLLNA